MTRPNEHHDTITSGLRIVAERPNGDGTYSPVDDPDATSPGGTISIIAKDRDGNAVLVTNAHVITGLRNSQPAGGDRVYHHEISGSRHIATVPQWDILRPAWVHRKGGLEGDGNNRMDVGYAVLESGVGVKFALHGHDDQHLPGETINVHTDRRIVPGTYDPSIGDKLVFLGRNSGEHKVTVTGLNSRQEVTGFRYIGLVSFSSTVDLIGGDSGAGLYRKVGDEYQLSCIFFTASNDRRTGYAFRASEAAEALGLTFGNRPPIAHAGPNRVINSNNPVILEGSVDDPDSADRNYVTQNHTWTQDSGPVTITLDPVADEPVHRTFTPEVVGVYFFTLTATDQEPLSASDTVRVSVWPSAQSVLPTRVRATAAARSVDITWTGPSIATGYQVEIGIPPSEGGQNHTFHTSMRESINIGSLIPQKTYEYRVRMTNADGVGPWTDWARTTTPGETPPTPTGDQWDVQYLNNKIQVKVTEIPEVIPAISQVRAKLGISPLGTGLGSDTITVTKNIGTALNRWVDVLTSAESNWQVGTWTAQVRFENTIGDPGYSPGKPVTVPNRAPTANPGYTQAVAAGSTVTLDGSRSSDPDGHSLTYRWEQLGLGELGIAPVTPVTISNSNQATATFVAPNQAGPLSFKLTVTDPGDLTHSANVTIHACSATGESRWYDTRETRCHNNARQKHQTQVKDGMTEFQWVADPDNEEWGAWQDTSASHRNEEPGDWRDSGRPTYALGNTWQTQERTVTFDKQQTRTSHCNNMQTQWNPATKTERRRVFGSGWPISRPPTPTGSQWTVRHLDNKLQVKVTSLPTVTSSIIEVRARLEGGSTSDRAKVIKPIGTTLNTWVTVLSSSDDRWREGAWVAKIRFENSEKNSNYSTTKPVTAPTTPTPPITPPAPPVVLPPLPPPTNVSATATARSVTVSWSVVSDATGYVVEIGIPPSAGGLGHTSDPTTGTSITISNLLPWTTYEYRVKATAEGRIGTWSGWATVVTPKEDPLTPTNDQWDIEYDSDNKIQAKVISLPAVIPAISEARVSMEIGQPPNLVTVTKAIGVSLGTWVDVLTSADTEWQSGTWAAHLRFENSVGNSSYSLPAKPVIVPTVPTTPPPIIDPDPWLDWTDALPPNNTRNEVIDAWTDTGNQRENQVLLIMEKEQTRTISWEKRQERTSQSGNRTESRWVDASRTETQWVEIPPPCTWTDTGQTRVDRYGSWSRTGRTRGSGADREREEERTVYREKQQSCTTNANTRYRWVSTTSTTETQWVADPVDPPCGPWSDTGNTRTSYGTYSRTGTTRGSGSSRQCEEFRTNATEKEQQRTCDNIIENRWVSTGTTTQTRWVSCPVDPPCGPWSATGRTRNRSTGSWSDTGGTQGCGPDHQKRQSRTATWQYEETRVCPSGTESRWKNESSTQYRWTSDPEASPLG